MAYFFYNLLLLLAAPVILPYSLYRALARGVPGERFWERLGALPPSFQQTAGESIWLHAVSVGEAIAATALVVQLRRRFPETPIFVSTTTATGQEVAQEKLSRFVDGVFYAPLDYSFAVRRVLEALRPRLVIVLETEIWPNLFRLSKQFGAGLMVANGRISDHSASRYEQGYWFFSEVLEKADVVLAQSEQDRNRFVAAGAPDANVQVGGNLKYDFEPVGSGVPREIEAFVDRLKPQHVILAGSTREQEEEAVARAFREVVKQHPSCLLIVAPRHPPRFEEAAKTLEASGLPLLRRSRLAAYEPQPVALPAVLLLDSLGELPSLYGLADVVFVGGSLNGWGGHNVLEPAHFGRAVIVGPYMQNFRAITEELLAENAIVQIPGPPHLASALQEVLSDSNRAEDLGARARRVAQRSRGATARAVEEAEGLYRSAVPQTPRGDTRIVLLKIPALLWEAAASLRMEAYKRGYLKKRDLPTFTLCVGNITAGGTGKTPLVMWLLEQLHGRGIKPAVMLRGYRRTKPERQTILPPGAKALPARSGDEAQVILRHLRREEIPAYVGIGANRHRVGEALFSAAHPDILLLDDGFQHLGLKRDLDLVLIDATDPFGGGEMLPLGRLREPLSSLARASAFVLTRTEPEKDYGGLVEQLRVWAPAAAVFHSRLEAVSLVDPAGKDLALKAAEGRRIVAFCGLGNPHRFWRMLRSFGAETIERIEFRDHHRYSPDDIARIRSAAQEQAAQLLVTTEKDLINLWHALEKEPAEGEDLDNAVARLFEATPLTWLRVKTVVSDGERLVSWIEERMAESSKRQPKAAKQHQASQG